MATAIWQANTRETRFEETPEGEKAPFSAYDMVGVVYSNDMNEVYEIMNLWNQPEKFSKALNVERVRSLSVGDILHMESGIMVQVAGIGFKPIKFDYTK